MSGRRIYLNLGQKIGKLLNPALCLACGIPIPTDRFICKYCVEAIETVTNPCACCGLPTTSTERICATCLHRPPLWNSMISPLVYGGITRKMIQELKFNEQLHFANALLTHTQHFYHDHPVDVLLPVPLHTSRLLERGFNQAEEIATILSRFVNIPVDRKSLKRIKATHSQSGLSISKRQKNILKAFEFTPGRCYKSAAIIDDIVTTGSTAKEISKILKKSGINHIEVWSLARALKHD